MKFLLVLFFLIIQTSFSLAQTATAPDSGSGTSTDPYKISSLDHLYWITQNPSEWGMHFIQVDNIDATSTVDWHEGKGWPAIGNEDTHFTGTYNGQGYTIDGLYINRPDENNQGLFGYVQDHASLITNLGLTGVNIKGNNNVGSIIGNSSRASITRSYATGNVKGNNQVGGIVGNHSWFDMISETFFNGEVTGNIDVGGLAGRVTHAYIHNSYSRGTVNGSSNVGGLIGQLGLRYETIKNTYSAALVNGTKDIGGLIGLHSRGKPFYGVYQSFWSDEMAGVSSSEGGVRKSIDEMKALNIYFNAGWDFVDETENGADQIWGIDESGKENEGYPFFTYQDLSHNITQPAIKFYPVVETSTSTAAITRYIHYWGDEIPEGHGLCWNTTGNPTVEDFVAEETVFPETGTIKTGIGDLEPNVAYYLRAYVVTENGVWYSEELQFSIFSIDPVKPEGSGTAGAPFQIASLNNLLWLTLNDNYWDKQYVQTADINASKVRNWDEDKGWRPIGSWDKPFAGNYNGQGHVIDSLYIYRPEKNYQGMFGYVGSHQAQIKDIGLSNVDITGQNYVGSVAGQYMDTDFKGCFADGTVRGQNNVGGIIGSYEHFGSVSGVFFNGRVLGQANVGGITGWLFSAKLENSFARGSVHGVSGVGGLVGNSQRSSLSNTYSATIVEGDSNAGGLAGSGGFEETNSFWDLEVSMQTNSSGGTGLSTMEMKDVASFTELSSEGLDEPWDFVGNPNDDTGTQDIWNIHFSFNDGYPFLNWQVDGMALLEMKAEPQDISAEFSGIGFYKPGEAVEISVAEIPRYAFQSWSTQNGQDNLIEDPKSMSTVFTMPESEVVLTATFLPVFLVETSVNLAHGGSVTGGGDYLKGEEVTLTANSSIGYHFVNWTEDGEVVLDGEEPAKEVYVFIAQEDRDLMANFAINVYTIHGTSENSNMGTVEGSGDYEYGQEVVLTAIPETGYHFVNWTEDGQEINTDPVYQFAAEKDRELVAHFAINVYTINATASDPEMGTVDGAGEFEHGQTVTLVATPKANHHFVNWADNGQVLSDEMVYEFQAEKDISIVGNFQLDFYIIQATASEGGILEPGGDVKVFYTHNQHFSVIPNDGHYIADVKVDDISIGAKDSYTFVNVTKNHTIHAEFDVLYFTITATAGEHGTIEPAGETTLPYGSSQTYVITPDQGYVVSALVVDGEYLNPDTSYTFDHIADDHAIHVEFSMHTITASASEGGNIEPEGSISVPHGGNQEFVFAPDTDYMIQDVLIDGQSIGLVDSYLFVNVTKDHTIHVEFGPMGFAVTFNVDMRYVTTDYAGFDFDPQNDVVYISGSMFEWADPGARPQMQTLSPTEADPMIYSKTLFLQEGTYTYKYYLNPGWDGAEFDSEISREIHVEGEMQIHDWFGSHDDPTGIAEISENTIVKAYPNPASHNLTIDSSEPIKSIQLTDMLGQVVRTAAANGFSHELNLSGLQSGIYSLQVTTQNAPVSIKIQLVQ